jgi:hypothetical protein
MLQMINMAANGLKASSALQIRSPTHDHSGEVGPAHHHPGRPSIGERGPDTWVGGIRAITDARTRRISLTQLGQRF